jgi:hypothetical protein
MWGNSQVDARRRRASYSAKTEDIGVPYITARRSAASQQPPNIPAPLADRRDHLGVAALNPSAAPIGLPGRFAPTERASG